RPPEVLRPREPMLLERWWPRAPEVPRPRERMSLERWWPRERMLLERWWRRRASSERLRPRWLPVRRHWWRPPAQRLAGARRQRSALGQSQSSVPRPAQRWLPARLLRRARSWRLVAGWPQPLRPDRTWPEPPRPEPTWPELTWPELTCSCRRRSPIRPTPQRCSATQQTWLASEMWSGSD